MSTADAPSHRQGQTIDTVDQLSSVTILAFALLGGLVSVGLLTLIGA